MINVNSINFRHNFTLEKYIKIAENKQKNTTNVTFYPEWSLSKDDGQNLRGRIIVSFFQSSSDLN